MSNWKKYATECASLCEELGKKTPLSQGEDRQLWEKTISQLSQENKSLKDENESFRLNLLKTNRKIEKWVEVLEKAKEAPRG